MSLKQKTLFLLTTYFDDDSDDVVVICLWWRWGRRGSGFWQGL